jgi:hypothetical protein
MYDCRRLPTVGPIDGSFRRNPSAEGKLVNRQSFIIGCAALALAVSATGCSAAGPSRSAVSVTSATSARVRSSELPVAVSVVPDVELETTPTDDTATLLSFAARRSDDEFVRFLEPEIVYLDGASTPSPVPTDYVTYLKSLRAQGAKIGQQTTVIVGGVRGHEFAISSLKNIENSIGCPATGGIANDTCWGITAGLALRFVVLTVRGRVLLIWARTGLNQPDPRFDSDFQKMLATVTFP